MRAVIQRVKQAHVTIDSAIVGQIKKGILIFLGVAKGDDEGDADYLARKIATLRMFEDDKGNLNLSAEEVHAEFLVVSQFTICGDCTKGRRPSFDKAADPQTAQRLYEYFVGKFKEQNIKVETGTFRAMMEVHLVNDGPVTFILESQTKK